MLVAPKWLTSTSTTLRSHEPYVLTTRRSPSTAKSPFGVANGVPDQSSLLRRVNANRSDAALLSSHIGCISLVGTRFFAPDEFVSVPGDWPGAFTQPGEQAGVVELKGAPDQRRCVLSRDNIMPIEEHLPGEEA